MSLQEFIDAATGTPSYMPLTQKRLEEMWHLTVVAGPRNGWTGTSGTLAAMIRELLRERAWLLAEIERLKQ